MCTESAFNTQRHNTKRKYIAKESVSESRRHSARIIVIIFGSGWWHSGAVIEIEIEIEEGGLYYALKLSVSAAFAREFAPVRLGDLA